LGASGSPESCCALFLGASGCPNRTVRNFWALLGAKTILCVRFGRPWNPKLRVSFGRLRVPKPCCAQVLGASGTLNYTVPMR